MTPGNPAKRVAQARAGSRGYAIIEAPSILGLKPSGVQRLPERLLGQGLGERIHARLAGRIETERYGAQRDTETLTLNAQAIARYTPKLADLVESVIGRGEFPVILGGDCSIVLGPALALRRRGRFGLLFIDGHADFYQPEANPNGEAASMDLAFATGFGPRLLTDLEGLCPLVRPEDAFVFGYRDAEQQREYGSQPLPSELRSLDLQTVRELGPEVAIQRAVEHLTRPELDGFFIHCDADCLNDDIMPAVDYRLADGLLWHEFREALEVALRSGKAVGLEITIYNPKLDRTGRAGRDLAKVLGEALGTRAPGGAYSFH
jgi:arginase